MDTYKTSFLFNKPFKSYGLLYFTTFSTKSICHTFASFGNTLAKLIELIFQSFCEDILLSKISLSQPAFLKSDWLLNFELFLTTLPDLLKHKSYGLFFEACLNIPKLVPGSQKDTFIRLFKLIHTVCYFQQQGLENFKVRTDHTMKKCKCYEIGKSEKGDFFKKYRLLKTPKPKCPGDHQILLRGLKLNSKISARKYIKKTKLTGTSWFYNRELSKNYVQKMMRFHKTCCFFGQNSMREGSISPSNFDEQLPNILFTCLVFG